MYSYRHSLTALIKMYPDVGISLLSNDQKMDWWLTLKSVIQHGISNQA